jgi:hypothetical protein
MPEKQALLAQQISIFLARGGWPKGEGGSVNSLSHFSFGGGPGRCSSG